MEKKIKLFYHTKPTIYSFIWRFLIFCVFIAGLFVFQFAFQSAKSFIEHVDTIISDVPKLTWNPISWIECIIYGYKVIKEATQIPDRIEELKDVLSFLIFLLSYSLIFGIRKFSVCSFYEKDVPKGIAFLLISILLFPILAPLYCVHTFFHLIIIYAAGFDIYVLWRLMYLIFTVFAYGTSVYLITQNHIWLSIVLVIVPLILRCVQVYNENYIYKWRRNTIIPKIAFNVIVFPYGVVLMFKVVIIQIVERLAKRQENLIKGN